MIEERRYRGGYRGRSPSPRRPPPRSRDWKLSPYRRRGVDEYSGEGRSSRRIEERDHFEDRVSRFSDYDRDVYEDDGRRFRSPRRIGENVHFERDRDMDRERPVELSNYGDGARGGYDNEVSVGGSRRSYNEDSYRGDMRSRQLKWDEPLDGSRKSDPLSWREYGLTRGSSGVGDVNVSSSGDRDFHLQNHFLDRGRAGLPALQYLDSTMPVSLKYENRGNMHSDSSTLARGGVDDLHVSSLSGGDEDRKRYFHFRDEPHLERRGGLNDQEDNYLEKESGSLHFQDRYQGVGKALESKIYKFKEEDKLLSSRGYSKGNSDIMVSTSQHKDYNHVPMGISREGLSGYSPTRDLHMPSSDVLERGSRLAPQPIRLDGYSDTEKNMLLAEPGGQLDDKRSSSHLYVGFPESRQGDWSYAEFGRSELDRISGRINDVEEDYRDKQISRINALKRRVDACCHKEQMEEDELLNQYPSFQVQSTPDVPGSLHFRREDVDTLGTESTHLNYGAEGYYGYGGVKTEKHHADIDGHQWSQYENSDPLQSREYNPTLGGLYDSPRKRLSTVDFSFVESCERSLRDKHIREEMVYEQDIGIRISADGKGARRIYNKVDVGDEIDHLDFSKEPMSSRSDYEKTWRRSSRMHSDEPSSSNFQAHRSIEPHKSDSRDIKKRLGPTQKLHVSQRLMKTYKPSIKKRLAPPPWIKNVSSTTISNEQNHPDGGDHYHDGNHSEDHLSLAKSEPPEKSEEFKQLMQSAFFKFLKQINETPIKRNKYMEQGRKAGILKCFVCGSISKEFVGADRLAMHAVTSKKVGVRSQHLGLHKALCTLMGWKITDHPSSDWRREVMSDAETRVLKEDIIIWPPIVVVHNSSIDNTSPGERVIISSEKLDTKLRDMGYKSILKVCYGKPANQSVLLVKFNGTLSGLREAGRLDKSYIKSKHGRTDFKQLKSECGSSRGKNAVSSEREDDYLYGYLGIAEDLDKLDFNTKKRCVLKSKKQILSFVDAPIDTVLSSPGWRISMYSTERSPNLYDRLVKCYRDRVSVIPVLDEWVAQVGDIRQQTLQLFITNFTKRRRFTPALHIVEWMSRSRNQYVITPKLAALQLDLLFKVYGIDEVEKYFNKLDHILLDYPVYVALLNCYAMVKYVEKAEQVMECVRKFKSRSTMPYNVMLSLYCTNREHVKLEALAREMQDEGIVYTRLTYEILLKGYARFDLERMERLLVKMESDYWDYINFHTYATVAKGYLKAGDSEKAYALLRKAESLTGVHGGSSTYLSLITYYAAMQRTEDVYRVWNLLPDFAELSNKYYVTMISSLEKLEDLDGARNILEEWEGTNADFDIEIPNLVIRAYCKKGGVRDAEIILKRLMDAGKELNALTFSHMALGYLKDGQMEKTVEFTKKAFLASLPSWKPNLIVVSACLEYLQEKKDANGMQEMLMLLEKYGSSKDGVKDIIQRFSSNEKPKTENRNKTAATGDFYIPLFSSIYGGKTS